MTAPNKAAIGAFLMVAMIVLAAFWLALLYGLYAGLRARMKAFEPRSYPALIVGAMIALPVLLVALRFFSGPVGGGEFL